MIRIGFIGLGYRGRYLLKLLTSMPDLVNVVALADPSPEEDLRNASWRIYDKGRDDYRRMVDTEGLDLVVIASPWACQVEQALYAVCAGCHVALEIKGGLGVGEYDELEQELQQRGLKAFPLENALFKREVLSLLQMCKAGLLGQVVYMRGGYRHDLRQILLASDGSLPDKGEGRWRLPYYWNGQADIYPTHGFAPLALIAGLPYHDNIVMVQSCSSASWGLTERMSTDLGASVEKSKILGDVISTQIRTEKGILITLTHDTTLPRPRSLDWEVQGTKGVWNGERRQIYIEGRSPLEQWDDDSPYINEYEHEYWTKWGEEALLIDKHHEGMDYIMLRAMIEDMLGGTIYPVGIKDLALWCSITELSKAFNPINSKVE